MFTEKTMVYTALMGWKNYIETGEFAGMDRETVLKLAITDDDVRKVAQRLPELSYEQKATIRKIEDLAGKVLNGGQIGE